MLGKDPGCSPLLALLPSFPPACRQFRFLPGPFHAASLKDGGGFLQAYQIASPNVVFGSGRYLAVLLMKTTGLPPHKPACSRGPRPLGY